MLKSKVIINKFLNGMNKTEILERLFGGSAKVKIIKLFLFNQRDIFDKDTISERSKSSSSDVRRELISLEKIFGGNRRPR